MDCRWLKDGATGNQAQTTCVPGSGQVVGNPEGSLFGIKLTGKALIRPPTFRPPSRSRSRLVPVDCCRVAGAPARQRAVTALTAKIADRLAVQLSRIVEHTSALRARIAGGRRRVVLRAGRTEQFPEDRLQGVCPDLIRLFGRMEFVGGHHAVEEPASSVG